MRDPRRIPARRPKVSLMNAQKGRPMRPPMFCGEKGTERKSADVLFSFPFLLENKRRGMGTHLNGVQKTLGGSLGVVEFGLPDFDGLGRRKTRRGQ
jgi:hypothetical protein